METVVQKSDVIELAKQYNIAESYVNEIYFDELTITREDFTKKANAYGKYMWGRQESDYYSDNADYWIDNHPIIRMITTTQRGWKQPDGVWKDQHSATIYYVKGEY
jgi:hypothetical protein